MTCYRCRGLMVRDHFFDKEESYGRPWITGWRCIACGNIIDPLIQRRRRLQSLERDTGAASRDGRKPVGA